MISLIECFYDVSYHLKSCHLSRVKVTEYELILVRAGNFHPSHDEITKLTVSNLGKYWRPLRTCQYPQLDDGPGDKGYVQNTCWVTKVILCSILNMIFSRSMYFTIGE